jgi:hypothetical protein
VPLSKTDFSSTLSGFRIGATFKPWLRPRLVSPGPLALDG